MSQVVASLRDLVSQGGLAGLLVGVGIIVALITLIGVGLYIAYLMSPQGKLETLADERRATPKRSVRRSATLALLCLLAIPFAIQVAVGQRAGCEVCHGPKIAKQISSVHASTSCGACHGARGVTAAAKNTLSFARWGWAGVIQQRDATKARMSGEIDPRTCLDCHQGVRQGVSTARGIRVQHSDFLGTGTTCIHCHGDVSHESEAQRTGPSMNDCLPCHDGKRASAACETCHVTDLASGGTVRGEDIPKVKTVSMSCLGVCHERPGGANKECTSCHGLTMPHPEGWSDPANGPNPGLHARAAFVNRDVCFRCHSKKDEPFTKDPRASCRCHGWIPGTMHGGKPWIQEHGLEATGKKQGELAECFICHNSNLCSYCHPASYQKLYNPKTGVDSYKRDTQRLPDEQKLVNGL